MLLVLSLSGNMGSTLRRCSYTCGIRRVGENGGGGCVRGCKCGWACPCDESCCCIGARSGDRESKAISPRSRGDNVARSTCSKGSGKARGVSVDGAGDANGNALLACCGLSIAPCTRFLDFWSPGLLEISYPGEEMYSRWAGVAMGANGAGVMGGYSVIRE